ncbi:MAG TPA: folate-binding protein [Dokdonella sp.]|uniref:CAF17-like 4Fe-4S cluster assembly/insertion protein YgfZ n=1 Tax=Dokdonella sp. TaxID=2291710 RepID=UPI002CAEE62C|nr:folate-binding protein [Dokdonella sp.]HUD42430.1 folate-binding protein [Dokdonella sp.]
MSTPLSAAQAVLIEGADAIAFANAQFTIDVAALAEGRWQWCAWLDAQGRALHVFALLRTRGDALLAWQPLGDAETMRAALARYVFRAKVTLRTLHDWTVRSLDAAQSTHPAPRTIAYQGDGYAIALEGDARIAWLGPGAIESVDADAFDRWRRADVAAGLPLIDAATRASFTPQALDLERIGAISFGKGCYPGQEIAARLHFRGGNKRCLRAFAFAADVEAPAPGTPIVAADGTAKGSVLYAARDALLGVVNDGDDHVPLHIDAASAIALSTMPFVD